MLHHFRILIFSLACGMLLVGSGCESPDSAASDLRVADFRYVKLPNGDREFTGTVVNDGSRPYAVVQVEVSLYGKDGARTGIQNIEVDDVSATSHTAFRTRVQAGTSVQRARVRRVMVP